MGIGDDISNGKHQIGGESAEFLAKEFAKTNHGKTVYAKRPEGREEGIIIGHKKDKIVVEHDGFQSRYAPEDLHLDSWSTEP